MEFWRREHLHNDVLHARGSLWLPRRAALTIREYQAVLRHVRIHATLQRRHLTADQMFYFVRQLRLNFFLQAPQQERPQCLPRRETVMRQT